MPLATADIYDENLDKVRVLCLDHKLFGGIRAANGLAVLVELKDDNRILFDILSQNGLGKILVIKVLSNRKPAVIGEKTAKLAAENEWQAIIIDGALRDTAELTSIPLCIAATTVSPFRLRTQNVGIVVKSLSIGGTVVNEGDTIIIDSDGIIALDSGS